MLLELYPIWSALKVWSCVLKGGWLVVHTDNEALVHVINKCSSKLHYANALLRDISRECMVNDVRLVAEHIPGKENVYADLLSRLQVTRLREMAAGTVEDEPTLLRENMTPLACKNMLIRF